MGLTVDDDVTANLNKLASSGSRAAKYSLQDVAYEILRLSSQQVPHDTGNLQNSGTVEPREEGYEVGYNTVYAARLHEHPQYRFQKGRKGKYLEDPIKDNAQLLGLEWGKNVALNLSKGV